MKVETCAAIQLEQNTFLFAELIERNHAVQPQLKHIIAIIGKIETIGEIIQIIGAVQRRVVFDAATCHAAQTRRIGVEKTSATV